MNPHRGELDSAIMTMLASATGKKWGLSQIPPEMENPPDDAYGILYQSPSPGRSAYGETSYDDPDDCAEFDCLLKSVGRSHRQAAWLSSKVHEAMLERIGSSWKFELSPTGLVVIDRAPVSKGTIVPSGDSLFEVSDIYRTKVMANG